MGPQRPTARLALPLAVLVVVLGACVAVPARSNRADVSPDELKVPQPLAGPEMAAADTEWLEPPSEVEELVRCGEDNVAAFNSASDGNDDPALLLKAHDCFAAVGHWPKAAKILKVLNERFPDFEHGHVFEVDRERALRVVLDASEARLTPWAAHCQRITSPLAGARCMQKGGYTAAALELFRIARAREGLSTADIEFVDEQIESSEKIIERGLAR